MIQPKFFIYLLFSLTLFFLHSLNSNNRVFAELTSNNLLLGNSQNSTSKKEKKTICEKGKPCRPKDIVRGDSFEIITPIGTLLNNRPKLSWTSVTGASSYIVRLQGSRGILWELEVNNTKILYPENQPPLEPGKAYDLIVKVIGGEEKQAKTRFIILTTEEAEEVKSKVENIRKENMTPQEKAFKIAELYENNKLIVEAEDAYQQALKLAKNNNDIDGQAWIQVKLARIHLTLENPDKAIILLKTAQANYKILKNQELSSQVAQLLGEVYKNNKQKEEAIRWYQQAKAGYELLKDQKNLEWVEKELSELN